MEKAISDNKASIDGTLKGFTKPLTESIETIGQKMAPTTDSNEKEKLHTILSHLSRLSDPLNKIRDIISKDSDVGTMHKTLLDLKNNLATVHTVYYS